MKKIIFCLISTKLFFLIILTMIKFVSKAKEISIEFLENNNSFSLKEWKELYKLSEETFVEETDSLKKKRCGRRFN